MDGCRVSGIEYVGNNLSEKSAIRRDKLEDVLFETTMNIVSEQLCFGNIGTGASSREIFSIWQFPKPVRLQPPEGILRMAALLGRTE
jgi:hypothetical protein